MATNISRFTVYVADNNNNSIVTCIMCGCQEPLNSNFQHDFTMGVLAISRDFGKNHIAEEHSSSTDM